MGMDVASIHACVMEKAWHLCQYDREDTEDLTQSVMLNLLMACKYQSIEVRESPLGYLRGSTTKAFLSLVRKQGAGSRGSGVPPLPLDESVSVAAQDDVEDQVLQKMSEERFSKAIAALSPGNRKVASLLYHQGLTVAQAAVRLNRPRQTVTSKRNSIGSELRRALRMDGGVRW
jgi:RNA polymerase sigma factor (sigma-70 family)